MFQIELPYPPSVNHYFRVFRGRTVIAPHGRAFRRQVCSILWAAATKPVEGKLCCSVDVYPPDRRRRDIDNVLKALMDALQHGGAFRDDSQIVWLLTWKASPVPGGKAVVRISRFGKETCRELCERALAEVTSWN